MYIIIEKEDSRADHTHHTRCQGTKTRPQWSHTHNPHGLSHTEYAPSISYGHKVGPDFCLQSSSQVTLPNPFSLVSSTPAVKYSQRQNSGNVVCTLNEGGVPTSWHGLRNKLELGYYDNELALKHPYQYMFQKVSEKAGSTCWN